MHASSAEASRMEHAPLMRIEAGLFEDREIPMELSESEMTPVLSARSMMVPTRTRAKRVTGFMAVSFGAVLLVAVLLLQGSNGPVWARVQDTVRWICGGLPPVQPVAAAAADAAAIAAGAEGATPPANDTSLPRLNFTLEKAIIASAPPNFTCFGTMNSSLPPVGTFLGEASTVGVIDAECGGPYTIAMPEDGVITGIQPLALPGEPVNPGAQLALYVPALPGETLAPSGPGFKLLSNPTTEQLAEWKVDKYDAIKGGDPVADFILSDGTVSTVKYDGPDGMVLSKQTPLVAGDLLAKGADLIVVGQAIFLKHTVSVGDNVSTNDTVALVQKAHDETPILSSEDAQVVALLTPYDSKEPIGLGETLEDKTFAFLGQHLAPLPSHAAASAQLRQAVTLYAALPEEAPVPGEPIEEEEMVTDNTGEWLAFKKYNVALGDEVKKGDVIAVCDKLKVNKITGEEVTFKSDEDGYVTELQPITPGTLIGPTDDIFEVDEYVPAPKVKPVKPAKEAAGFPWWLLFLLCLLCCLLCFFAACCVPGEKKLIHPVPVVVPVPETKPKPVAPAPAPVVAAPAPVEKPKPKPKPAPAPAPAAPPKGVPIYFDGNPYYLEYQPIGIKFKIAAPITVQDYIFNSQAKVLGIKKGQRLTKIKDFDVQEDRLFSQVDKRLLDAEKDLPYWPLRVDFRDPGTNQVERYDFVERPLGILFNKNRNPVRVEKFRPNSLAESKGVQKGWEIVRIAELDTTKEGMAALGITSESAAYSHVDKHLMEGLKHLPTRK